MKCERINAIKVKRMQQKPALAAVGILAISWITKIELGWFLNQFEAKRCI